MPLPLSVIPPQLNDNDPANAAKESAETIALLARRRSSKLMHLAEPGPTAAEIDALIELAARVPDHGKIGPWRFVVIEGEARARAGAVLAEMIRHDEGVDETRLEFVRGTFLRAPLCVMVVSAPVPHKKVPEWEQQLSAGAVCFNLLLAAHALGYAGCWLTEWQAFDVRAAAALGVGESERIAGFLYFGTAAQGAAERVRADVRARVSRF
ncbi:MAG TPA: nitroreductase [Vitreimonas sp.]|uniref:nitroreductase family protein n=1 Tax=Vitreimonas sp. TaxID=3069702 RepID=UPI002D2B84B6|nr:nitroreductase [Vitreimonas sp.]HYD88549.1 nitroreductase [Vitreimonas sp.]